MKRCDLSTYRYDNYDSTNGCIVAHRLMVHYKQDMNIAEAGIEVVGIGTQAEFFQSPPLISIRFL